MKGRYTVKDIAQFENVSVRLVYDWIRLGFLQADRYPSLKDQGRYIITEEQLNEFRKIYKKIKK